MDFQMPSMSSLSFSNLKTPSPTSTRSHSEWAPHLNLAPKPRRPELSGEQVERERSFGVPVLLVVPPENPERDVRQVPEVAHNQRIPADDFPARVRNSAVVLAHGGRRCLHTRSLSRAFKHHSAV